MILNEVIAGDYKGYGISLSFKGYQIVHGFKFKLRLNKETIESFEEVDRDVKRSAGKVLVGGALLGGVGALMGATSKKTAHTCKIVFKDGKKCLVKLNDDAFKYLQTELF